MSQARQSCSDEGNLSGCLTVCVSFLSPQSAVGLFNSKVTAHLLLFANRGSKDYAELRERLSALAPEFTGKVGISTTPPGCSYRSQRFICFNTRGGQRIHNLYLSKSTDTDCVKIQLISSSKESAGSEFFFSVIETIVKMKK